ncbi:MAG: hypothetical protein KC416_03130 [Myxococcales bacterium]|nr:hypothetical protein [Myxococcales bacterium]
MLLVAGALALLLFSGALWASLRGLFSEGASLAQEVSTADGDRRALLTEKEALLEGLQDLAFDHEMGKLSAEDYQRQEELLRRRAKEVLRLLDEDLGEYRARAKELVAARIGGGDDPGC